MFDVFKDMWSYKAIRIFTYLMIVAVVLALGYYAGQELALW